MSAAANTIADTMLGDDGCGPRRVARGRLDVLPGRTAPRATRIAAHALAAVMLWIGVAHAQPGLSTSASLREANTAALAGDWPRVSQLVEPLLQRRLTIVDLGETHRLAGLAAFFQQHSQDAESHFLAYLRVDLASRLDPMLYSPDVVAFFNDVAARHAPELRTPRLTPKRSWLFTLLPPAGQLQNGDRTKAYVLGGVLGSLLIANLATYYYLSSWCDHTDGAAGGGLSCYDGGDRNHSAARLRPYNIASGVAFLAVYAYGAYDGIRGYRRRSREQSLRLLVDASAHNYVLGIAAGF